MKLDAETLRKLALAGAKTQLRELEKQCEAAREIVRQLSGASVPGPKPKASLKQPTQPKRRKRRTHDDKFKAMIVKEAEANNASAVGKKHNLSPSLVRNWMDKAAK